MVHNETNTRKFNSSKPLRLPIADRQVPQPTLPSIPAPGTSERIYIEDLHAHFNEDRRTKDIHSLAVPFPSVVTSALDPLAAHVAIIGKFNDELFVVEAYKSSSLATQLVRIVMTFPGAAIGRTEQVGVLRCHLGMSSKDSLDCSAIFAIRRRSFAR